MPLKKGGYQYRKTTSKVTQKVRKGKSRTLSKSSKKSLSKKTVSKKKNTMKKN